MDDQDLRTFSSMRRDIHSFIQSSPPSFRSVSKTLPLFEQTIASACNRKSCCTVSRCTLRVNVVFVILAEFVSLSRFVLRRRTDQSQDEERSLASEVLEGNHVQVAMGGYQNPDGSRSSRSFSLESVLQQAWLQSQRPKVPRRSASSSEMDVSLEKRASSAQRPSGVVVPGSGADAGDASGSEESYFHKTRYMPEDALPEVLRGFAPPQLECYSEKTDLPWSGRNLSVTSSSDGVTSDKSSSICSASESHGSSSCSVSNGMQASVDDRFDAVDFEGDSADMVRETEATVRFLDEILSNKKLEEEKCVQHLTTALYATGKEVADHSCVDDDDDDDDDDAWDREAADIERWSNAELLPIEEILRMEKNGAYQAMAEEISNLISSEPTIRGTEVLNHDSSNRAEFMPSEEKTALKLMEAFTCMLSKHIMDVSMSNAETVDYKTWITESDKIDAHFDDNWKSYLEDYFLTSPGTSRLTSNLLQGGAGSNLPQDIIPCTNMKELLYRCAVAVNRGDTGSATDCLEELRKHSSPEGNSMERMAHYFREALVARLSGTGEQLYTVITNNHPSSATMLRANRLYVDNCPYIKLKYFLSMKHILDAFEGATRVHVINYGMLFGIEFPSLIQHLSMRPGGPPQFRLTGIDYPYPGDDPLMKLNENGRRLEEFAKIWGVPFEFHAFAGSWESFTAKDLNIRKEEVLAVSSYRTHLILDESVLGASPRELLLRRIRSFNPKIFALCVESAACNAPFFMTRFRESVKYYSAIYDGLEIALPSESPGRVILEREFFGRQILNIVACEGQARIERAEPYRQWQNRMIRAGFLLQPVKPVVFSKVKAMMASFHKDFGIAEDDGWILVGIKDQVVSACSVWEPKPVSSFIPEPKPVLDFIY